MSAISQKHTKPKKEQFAKDRDVFSLSHKLIQKNKQAYRKLAK